MLVSTSPLPRLTIHLTGMAYQDVHWTWLVQVYGQPVLAFHTITLPPPCGTQFKKVTSPNLLPTQHHKHCLPSIQYSESQVSNFSNVPATPSKVSICPLKLVLTTMCNRFNTLVRKYRMRISFPEMLSDSLYRNSWFCKPVATLIIQMKKPVLEVLVWRDGYTWSVVVRLVVCAAKLSETTLESQWNELSILGKQVDWWTFLRSVC